MTNPLVPEAGLLSAELTFQTGDPSKESRVVSRYNSLVVIPCTYCCGPKWQIELEAEMHGGQTSSVRLELKQTSPTTFCYVAHRPRVPSLFETRFLDGNIHLGSSGVQIVPLGGVGEAGANACILIIYGQEAMMVDCGINVGELDAWRKEVCSTEAPAEPEVSPFLLPNYDLAEDYFKAGIQLVGILITHDHFDHIGGLPAFISRFFPDGNYPPILAGRFSCSLAARRLEEKLPDHYLNTQTLNPREPVRLGEFTITPFEVPHSIIDSLGYSIQVGGRTILCTGDFKLRHGHDDLYETLATLREFKQPDLAIVDATYASAPGWSALEAEVELGLLGALNRFFITRESGGRLFVTFFSSHWQRLKNLVRLTRRLGYDKPIGIMGKSFDEVIQAADANGERLPLAEGNPARSEILVITGCQATLRSVAVRLSQGRSAGDEASSIRLKPGDLFALAANPIPGHGRDVERMLAGFREQGVEIIVDHDYPGVALGCQRDRLHASGHEYAGGHAAALNALEPRFLLPYHASPSNMVALADNAYRLGLAPEEIILPAKNGLPIQL